VQTLIKTMDAAIFDLDGVIVNTAKYHYLAWRRLAKQLGFDFTETDNERLKGVSRLRSLEILLEIGGKEAEESARQAMSAQKNTWYVEYIRDINPDDLLPGVVGYIRFIRQKNVKTAIASASNNAVTIMDRLQIASLFDVIMDGTKVHNAKPDPEVFVRAAQGLGIPPEGCVVFEDSEAGIEAAHRAGMGSVGVGKPENLINADMVIANFQQLLVLNLLKANDY
jgi:beta-phosphoglucomutase